jgi:catechol 2,3-dioxygenase-like lactoylglutathione lyase family enzyme
MWMASGHDDRPVIAGISPFFIVSDMSATLAFYCDDLGFEVTFRGEDPDDPYFAIVQRDQAMIMLKSVGMPPLPNPQRHWSARWDAYLHVPDPDALAAELALRGVEFSVPLMDTDDGLRGFEIEDVDGYVLFMGRPST